MLTMIIHIESLMSDRCAVVLATLSYEVAFESKGSSVWTTMEVKLCRNESLVAVPIFLTELQRSWASPLLSPSSSVLGHLDEACAWELIDCMVKNVAIDAENVSANLAVVAPPSLLSGV